MGRAIRWQVMKRLSRVELEDHVGFGGMGDMTDTPTRSWQVSFPYHQDCASLIHPPCTLQWSTGWHKLCHILVSFTSAQS